MFLHKYWEKNAKKKRSEQDGNKMNLATALRCRVITVAGKRCVHGNR